MKKQVLQLAPALLIAMVGASQVQAETWQVNCGGASYTAQDGTFFEADTFYTGGKLGSGSDPIAATEDDTLYQTERWGEQFSYIKNLENGRYTITLKFAEVYWSAPGKRVFSVDIEGQNKIPQLDLVSTIGKNAAYDVVLKGIELIDGELNLDFNGSVDAAKISAISVAPEVQTESTTWSINAGSEITQNGVDGTYNPDEGFTDGTASQSTATVLGSFDGVDYQSERWGEDFSYHQPIKNGTYNVQLKFAEFFWDEPGQRIFNVEAEGNPIIQNLDIVAQVGKNAAYDVIANGVEVNDGALDIHFSSTVDAAKVSAIVVTSDRGTISFNNPAEVWATDHPAHEFINILADTYVPDGLHITAVDLEVDQVLYGTKFNAPFQWQLSQLSEGLHSAKLTLTTSDGVVVSTPTRTFNVTAGQETSSVVWATNVGGPTYTSAEGITFQADEGFTGGEISSAELAISGTDDDALYQTDRWGLFSYKKQLPAGSYKVTLKFAETYWEATNKRVFNGDIEGARAFSDLDIVANVGYGTAYDFVIDKVIVQDGELNLNFTASVDAAKLSGILVERKALKDPELVYAAYTPNPSDRVISRTAYLDKLHGFWLAESIANWTGLITEMDKIAHPFYTDFHWGTPDQANIWGFKSPYSANIDFYFGEKGQPWGSDDDTDIEYIYQHLLDTNNTSVLSPEQIKEGWLKHIYSNEEAPNGENFLWVSNETAYYLMKDQGILPPATSEPANNPDFEMIDAQLTTEIFGLFAPARPDVALNMAHLPIRTTAKNNAEWISEFYVVMYSLASAVDENQSMKDQVFGMADQARAGMPGASFAAKMYDFIKASYENNADKSDWESTRDAVYQRYQISNADGYIYGREFDAGINFAASLVSLFYGEGDIVETVRIGSLAGWDSDNPTATWGGLYGFMLGKSGVEQAFNQTELADTYWIHRTRRNFPDYTPGVDGEDTFPRMAEGGVYIIDRVVQEEMGGGVDLEKDVWYIPEAN